MELIRCHKTYHLTWTIRTLAMALLVQAMGVSLVTVWATKKALTEAVIANLENRALLKQAKADQQELTNALLNRYQLTLAEPNQ